MSDERTHPILGATVGDYLRLKKRYEKLLTAAEDTVDTAGFHNEGSLIVSQLRDTLDELRSDPEESR